MNERMTLQRPQPIKAAVQAKPKQRLNLMRFIPNMKVSMFLILVLQLILVLWLVNPFNVFQQLALVQVLNNVSNLASVPPTEIPVIAVIGDNKTLPDITQLRDQNNVTKEVYKDAQNGDYVLAYSSRMIIYRRGDNTIIYNDDSPQAIFTKSQQAMTASVIKIAKDNNIVAKDSEETPLWYVVNDPTKEKAKDSTFYKNLEANDVIATFPTTSAILIYRPSNNSLINSGTIESTVSP